LHASHKTVTSRCSRRLNRLTTPRVLPWLCRFAAGLSPASSTGASARLYELFGRLKSVGKFLVLYLLLQVLYGIILLLL